MRSRHLQLFPLLIFPLLSTPHALATDLISNTSSTVEATVPPNAGPTATIDTTPPTIPILLRPIDGTYTNHSRPEFVWLRSQDTNSNTVLYDLYLNHQAMYLGIPNQEAGITSNYTSRHEDGSIRLLPINSLPDGIYDWSVTAYDLSNNQHSSTLWHLVIDTQPPTLELTAINNIPHSAYSNQPFSGPLTLPLTFLSEPNLPISIALYNEQDNTTISLSGTTNSAGNLTLFPYLNPGDWQLLSEVRDLAGNLTTIPALKLTINPLITTPTIPLPDPLPDIPPLPIPPLSTLPSTIMLVATRASLANYPLYLLALTIILLLITRHKKNIRLLSIRDRKPLQSYTITDSNNHTTTTDSRGYAYLPNLGEHSYLLILNSQTSLSLCLTKHQSLTTIAI